MVRYRFPMKHFLSTLLALVVATGPVAALDIVGIDDKYTLEGMLQSLRDTEMRLVQKIVESQTTIDREAPGFATVRSKYFQVAAHLVKQNGRLRNVRESHAANMSKTNNNVLSLESALQNKREELGVLPPGVDRERLIGEIGRLEVHLDSMRNRREELQNAQEAEIGGILEGIEGSEQRAKRYEKEMKISEQIIEKAKGEIKELEEQLAKNHESKGEIGERIKYLEHRLWATPKRTAELQKRLSIEVKERFASDSLLQRRLSNLERRAGKLDRRLAKLKITRCDYEFSDTSFDPGWRYVDLLRSDDIAGIIGLDCSEGNPGIEGYFISRKGKGSKNDNWGFNLWSRNGCGKVKLQAVFINGAGTRSSTFQPGRGKKLGWVRETPEGKRESGRTFRAWCSDKQQFRE